MRDMRGLRIAAVFVVFALTISIHNSFGQSGLPDDCARTAQMDIYSNAQVSEVTGDLSGFELALGKQIESRRKALLFCTRARLATAYLSPPQLMAATS